MHIKSIFHFFSSVAAAVGINSVPVFGLLWSNWHFETAMMLYMINTLLAIPVTALMVRLTTKEESAFFPNGTATNRIQTRRRMLEGYWIFAGGFSAFAAFFLCCFLFLVLKLPFDLEAIRNGVLYSAAFLLLGFISHLVFRPVITLQEAEKVLEGTMGRVALIFLAVFCGFWLATISEAWFIVPFALLKTISDIGEPIQSANALRKKFST
ncbi:MAG: DUF6498-containing protein [Caldilineaceae bacterium]